MKTTSITTLSRFLLYTGIITQLIYIFMTPFIEISTYILFSTAFMLTAGYMDLFIAKKELIQEKTKQELAWENKRKRLQNYYNNEANVNKSFSKCLQQMQLAETHNERISKILDNYQTNKKQFKIKLNRKPENRLDQYLQE